MNSHSNISSLLSISLEKLLNELFNKFVLDFHKEDTEAIAFRKDIRLCTEL
jgi:hypothetical protein